MLDFRPAENVAMAIVSHGGGRGRVQRPACPEMHKFEQYVKSLCEDIQRSVHLKVKELEAENDHLMHELMVARQGSAHPDHPDYHKDADHPESTAQKLKTISANILNRASGAHGGAPQNHE